MEFLPEIRSLIFSVPYIVRVLCALACILLANKVFNNLLAAMFAGTLLLAFWSGHTAYNVIFIAFKRFSSSSNLFLLFSIFLILLFSTQMKLSGMMERLVDSVKKMSSPRFSIAVLPALIGLLPMPGGAIFSAPLVESTDQKSSIEPVRKAAINYWFRHVWEYWWPLYPGVLLAAEISGIGLYTLVFLMLPLSVFSIGGGMLFLLKNIDKTRNNSTDIKGHLGELFYAVLPIVVVIGITVLIRSTVVLFVNLNAYLPIAVGTLCGILFLQCRNPVSWETWKSSITSPKNIQMLLLVAVIRIFGAYIESPLPGGILLMDAVRSEFAALGIPLVLTIIGIPFICGLSTGIAVGFVGASFPIVMSLIGTSPESATLHATAVLAYGAGYIGMILSPVHVCLIVSNEYFKSRLLHSLKFVFLPSLVVFAGAVLLYGLYR